MAFAVLAVAHLAPPLPGLEPQAQTVCWIFAWFVILLAAEALPRSWSGSELRCCVLLNGTEVADAFNAYSDDILFLILGAFVLVAVMVGTASESGGIVPRGPGAPQSHPDDGVADGRGTTLLAILPTVSETALFLPISRCLGELSEGQRPSV